MRNPSQYATVKLRIFFRRLFQPPTSFRLATPSASLAPVTRQGLRRQVFVAGVETGCRVGLQTRIPVALVPFSDLSVTLDS